MKFIPIKSERVICRPLKTSITTIISVCIDKACMGCKPSTGFDFYSFNTYRFPKYFIIIANSARRPPFTAASCLRPGFIVFVIVSCQTQRFFDQRISQCFIPFCTGTGHNPVIVFILVFIGNKQVGKNFIINAYGTHRRPFCDFDGGVLISGQAIRNCRIMVIAAIFLDFIIQWNIIPDNRRILQD